MPKTEIDYSNTIIYKITCNDVNNKDVYVGHTTNFVQRKHAHKQSCINEKSTNYKCKLYEVIRNNGGWNNWKMEIVNFFNCKDHYEARIKEQEFFVSLNATLNSIEPFPKPKIPIHNEIIKEEPLILINDETVQTSFNKFCCQLCHYNTCKKTDFNKHLGTDKHVRNTSATQKSQNIEHHKCQICHKIYQNRTGLWRHQKKCNLSILENNDENTIIKENILSPEMIMSVLLQQNNNLQQQLIEQNKIILELSKNKQSQLQ
jgi:hypothetical protein